MKNLAYRQNPKEIIQFIEDQLKLLNIKSDKAYISAGMFWKFKPGDKND